MYASVCFFAFCIRSSCAWDHLGVIWCLIVVCCGVGSCVWVLCHLCLLGVGCWVWGVRCWVCSRFSGCCVLLALRCYSFDVRGFGLFLLPERGMCLGLCTVLLFLPLEREYLELSYPPSYWREKIWNVPLLLNLLCRKVPLGVEKPEKPETFCDFGETW